MLNLIGKLLGLDFGEGVLVGFLLGVAATLVAHWLLYPPAQENARP